MIDIGAVVLLMESAPQNLCFLEILALAVNFLLVVEFGLAIQFLQVALAIDGIH